jgi:type IX secretion system PorP/SprF family membrane protein
MTWTKKNIAKILLTGLLVAPALTGAQDIFFTQFYNSQLMLNPALTGFIPYDMQVVMNFRDNHNGLIPYNSYAGSFEMKVARIALKPDVFAWGIVSAMDNFDRGRITQLNTRASAAFHRALDNKATQFISIGIQPGIIQRSADPNTFSHPSQWVDGVGYVEDVSNNEGYVAESTLSLDLNAGIFYYGVWSRQLIGFIGYGAYHLNQPTEKFLGNNEHLPMRSVMHGGIKISSTPELNIVPNFIVMYQGKAKQIAEGLTFEYIIDEKYSSVKLATLFRHSDNAFSVMAGVRFLDFQLAVSSDFLSSVQRLSNSKSSLEFSLIYSISRPSTASLDANPRNKY